MKKDYLKPESNVVEISIDAIMQITSDGNQSSIPGTDDKIDEDDAAAGRNRGEWGNVWGK